MEQFGNAMWAVPNPRIGRTLVTGTPTGRAYNPPNDGDWVHVRDWLEYIKDMQRHTKCCGLVTAFFEGVPSAAQVHNLPAWAYGPTTAVLKPSVVPGWPWPEPAIEEVQPADVARPDVPKARKVRRVAHE